MERFQSNTVGARLLDIRREGSVLPRRRRLRLRRDARGADRIVRGGPRREGSKSGVVERPPGSIRVDVNGVAPRAHAGCATWPGLPRTRPPRRATRDRGAVLLAFDRPGTRNLARATKSWADGYREVR